MTAKRKGKKKKQHRLFWFAIRMQFLLMLLVLAGVGYYFFGGYADEVQRLKREAVTKVSSTNESFFVPSQSCEIYDKNGMLISERKGEKNAQYISYEDIPKDFVAAMISIEDKKFYNHRGVDFKAVVRAAKAMVKARLQKIQSTQGASTITMQLAKLMYMEPDRSWQYKVEQMFLAMELEKRYSKEKILEFYLNNIYFSNGYYGIEAASLGYFNCGPEELNLSQVAFLCAIPNSPSYYDPVVNYDHTIERRNRILKNMLEDGKITQERYYEEVNRNIVLNRPQKTGTSFENNYVDTYVYYCATRALMEQEGFSFRYYFSTNEEKEEYEAEFDELYAVCQKRLYAGGYKIHTSIDMEKQRSLQDAVDEGLKDYTDTYEDGTYELQGSAVCIDNENGQVVAIVGGRKQDFGTYTLNRAYQSHRQPGSAIKPLIVYTPAFERGYTPDTIVNDYEFEDGPSNAGGVYYGEISLRKAIAKSLNTVAWQLYEELTPEVGLSYLKNMNFSAIVKADYIPATSLGGFTHGASALEMAAGYATIEHDGLYRQPTCIRSIVDKDENIVYLPSSSEVVIYDKTAARMTTDALISVMTEGTGRKLNLENMPCAGKTGTTNDHKDGWFVGYTRYYTTSVWVGCDYPKKLKELSGNSYPEQIWNTYMSAIHEGLTPMEFLPFAQLSEEFRNQQLQEEQERENRREEGRWEPVAPDNETPNAGQEEPVIPDNGDLNGDQEDLDIPDYGNPDEEQQNPVIPDYEEPEAQITPDNPEEENRTYLEE